MTECFENEDEILLTADQVREWRTELEEKEKICDALGIRIRELRKKLAAAAILAEPKP